MFYSVLYLKLNLMFSFRNRSRTSFIESYYHFEKTSEACQDIKISIRRAFVLIGMKLITTLQSVPFFEKFHPLKPDISI